MELIHTCVEKHIIQSYMIRRLGEFPSSTILILHTKKHDCLGELEVALIDTCWSD